MYSDSSSSSSSSGSELARSSSGKRNKNTDDFSMLSNEDDNDTVEENDDDDDGDETAVSNKSSSVPHTLNWEENFELLKKYHSENGDCSVPFNNEWRNLANWLDRQNRRRGLLEPEQVARLESISAFKPRGRQVSHVSWDERFSELVAFKEKHGNCNIPRTAEFKRLRSWLHKSRQCRNKSCGTNRQLSQAQIDKLISVGALEPDDTARERHSEEKESRVSKSWEDQYEELEGFRRQFGHCKVPVNETKWKSLAQWLRDQKLSYDEKRLSMYQLRKLEAVGVVQIHHRTKSGTSLDNSQNATQSVGAATGRTVITSSPQASSNRKSSFTVQYDDDDQLGISASKKRRNGPDSEDWFPCRVHVIQTDWTTREIGFILLSSRSSSTLAEARRKISDTLILDPSLRGRNDFDFHLPLGPISQQQEASVGPMCHFLKHYDPVRGFSKEGDSQLFIVKRSKKT